jgi:hypothetical protein
MNGYPFVRICVLTFSEISITIGLSMVSGAMCPIVIDYCPDTMTTNQAFEKLAADLQHMRRQEQELIAVGSTEVKFNPMPPYSPSADVTNRSNELAEYHQKVIEYNFGVY